MQRTTAHIAFLLASLGVLGLAQGQSESREFSSCSLRLVGDVVDAQSHEPIAGATVYVNGEAVALADIKGHFSVGNLCRGPTRVEAERYDYELGGASFSLQSSMSVEIDLVVGNVGSETVVIRGQELSLSPMQSSGTIAGEDLAERRGQSLSEVTASLPGVTELSSGSGMGKPVIRGHLGRRLALVQDGFRHRSQSWGLDHAPEIDPFSAESVEVVRGAAAVRHGPGAMGGAVVVSPWSFRRDPGEEGELQLFGQSNGWGGGVSGRLLGATESLPLSYRVTASQKRLAAQRTPDYPLDNSGQSEVSAEAAVSYRKEHEDWQLSYRLYSSTLGVCACLRAESLEDFDQGLAATRPVGSEFYQARFAIDRPRQEVLHHTLGAGLTLFDRPWGKLSFKYSFQRDERSEFDTVRTATGPQFLFNLDTHDLGFELVHKPVHLGNHLHLRGSYGVAGTLAVHDYVGLPLLPDYRSLSAGVYGIERLVSHDTELELGLRHDAMARSASFDDQDFRRMIRSGQFEDDSCGPEDAGRFHCRNNFQLSALSLGARQRWHSGASIGLNGSLSARAPSVDEQFLNGTSPTSPVFGLGDPELDAEVTYGLALTATLEHKRISGEVSVFGQRIDNYINFSPALGEDGEPLFDVLIRGTFPRFTFAPVDAIFVGADGGAHLVLDSEFSLDLQGAYVQASDRATGRPLVFIPPFNARTSVNWNEEGIWGSESVGMSARVDYTARQERFDADAELAPPPAGRVLLSIELRAVAHTALGRTRFGLSGTNITNERYRDYTSLARYFADRPGAQWTFRTAVEF